MPQFDKITFFNQIFWLLFSFLSFYFLFLRLFLPKISTVLKIRTKILLKNYSVLNSSEKKASLLFLSFNEKILAVNLLNKNLLLKNSENSEVWLQNSFLKIKGVKKMQNFFFFFFTGIFLKKFSF